MDAIMFTEFGGPDVLGLVERPVPEPGPGQVRIRVRRIGVNPLEGKIRAGLARHTHPAARPPLIPGSEIAGTVDALGPDTAGLAVGDEVLGWSEGGAYAQYVLSRPEQLVARPPALGWDAAAALPVGVHTALQVLDALRAGPGDVLLVHAASGVVGGFTVQLAADRGATVIGTAGPANQEYVRELGALPVEYGEGLPERVRALAPDGVDAVLDAAGRPGVLDDSIALRGGSTDRIVTIVDPRDAEKYGVRFSFGGPPDAERRRALAAWADAAARGRLRVRIGAVRPLADAAELQRISDAGHAGGKLVLAADDGSTP